MMATDMANGKPFRKLLVPSIGSTTKLRNAGDEVSSPMKPEPGIRVVSLRRSMSSTDEDIVSTYLALSSPLTGAGHRSCM